MSDDPKEHLRRVRTETTALLRESGALAPGLGLVTTVSALALAVLSLLAVLSFHFPAYLTTPELRAKYSVPVLRQVLFGSLVIAGSPVRQNFPPLSRHAPAGSRGQREIVGKGARLGRRAQAYFLYAGATRAHAGCRLRRQSVGSLTPRALSGNVSPASPSEGETLGE